MSKRSYRIVNATPFEAFEHPILGKVVLFKVETTPDVRQIESFRLHDEREEVAALQIWSYVQRQNGVMDGGLVPVTDRLN